MMKEPYSPNPENENRAASLCTLLYEGSVSTESGGEFTLPDYLPDIRRILRVTADPQITGNYMNGEKTELEGNIPASLIYLSEENTVHVFPVSTTFEQSIPISGIDENSIVSVHTTADSTVCRLSGPRKFNLRHKLKTGVRALTSLSVQPEVNDAPPSAVSAVCMDKTSQPSCTVLCTEESELRYSEDIPSPFGTVKEILSCEVTAIPTETRVSDGAVSFKGDFRICTFCAFQAENGEIVYRSLVRRVPFSESIPAAGGTDIAKCEPDISVTDAQAQSGDEGRICAVDFVCTFSAVCMTDTTVYPVSDAFLPGYEVKLKKEDVTAFRPLRMIHTGFSVSESMKYDPSDRPEQVADCVCTVSLDQHAFSDGQLKCSGVVEFTVIAESAEHQYFPITGTFPVKWETDVSGMSGEVLCNCTARVLGCGCRIDKNQHSAVCDAEIALFASVCQKERMPVTTSLTLSKETKKDTAEPCPILICYPTEGERFWDIAKHYRVSPEKLKAQNQIAPERNTTLKEDKMLFIPTAEAFNEALK